MPPYSRLTAFAFLAVAMLWSLALFLRSAPYTPDEPREFDLAWNMLGQSDKAVPLLAGEPFCEKPPLTYWAAAASMAVFGKTPEAARLPNLLWIAITLACLLSWIRRVVPADRSEQAVVLTTLTLGSAFLLFRVQIWFATDAPLVAATAVGLLGAWRGLQADTRRERLTGYVLLNLGLAAAFFSKNLLGWLVPVAAFGGMVIWERRWRELLRWELYVGVVLLLALILPWLLAVARHEDGARLLRIFLIDNTLGRLLPIATEDQYQLGHRNHVGKYLLELPYYLVPWTFAAIAALRWGYQQLRTTNTVRRALRFTALSILPGFLFLSLSKTARDVYVAPELLGFAMLLGLWFGCGFDAAQRFDRLCLRFTTVLAILVGALFVALSIAIPLVQGAANLSWLSFAGAFFTVIVIAWLMKRLQRTWPTLSGAVTGWGFYSFGIVAVCAFLFPALDRSQDLRPTAQAVAAQFGSRPIAVLREDETIRAYLDFGGNIAATNLRSTDEAVDWLSADTRRVLLVELWTDHVTPAARAKLASWRSSWRNLAPVDVNPSAAELQKRGLQVLWQYEVPGGRTYGVLSKS